MMQKVFVDCDPGVDDSVALLYLLRRKDVKVLGISTGFGNTSAKQGAENAARLIELSQVQYQIPVGVGSEIALNGEKKEYPTHIHGNNGLGNIDLPLTEKPDFTDGIELLVETMRQNPGEVILITLGRFTNIAKALEIEPELPRLVKQVVGMGGTVYHPGNAAPLSEANIIGDPEAADKVFQAGFDISMAGLDVTMSTWLSMEKLRNVQPYLNSELDRKVYNYITTVLPHYMKFNAVSGLGAGVCPVHDPSAMLLALEPQLYETRKIKARVECKGEFTKGQIVVDTRPSSFDAEYVNFALKVDAKRAVDYLLQGLFFPDTSV